MVFRVSQSLQWRFSKLGGGGGGGSVEKSDPWSHDRVVASSESLLPSQPLAPPVAALCLLWRKIDPL